jgi:hypothetical protein
MSTHLKPMDFGEILDGAFRIYRAHFATLFLAALAPYLPMVLAGSLLGAALGAQSESGMLAGGIALLVSAPLMLVGLMVAWGALVHLTSEAFLGHPVEIGQGVRRGWARSLSLFGATLLMMLLLGIGLIFLVVPAFILMAVFFAVYTVVVVEGRGPVEALGRSRQLSRGDLPRIFGVLFVAYIIAALPGWSISILTVVSFSAAEPSLGFNVASTILQAMIGALTWPLSTGVSVLLYYDRRIRTEALDVQLAAERLSPTAV